jgi:hypothetical protein
MLDMSSQSLRVSFAERGLDLYETPSVAVTALLDVEQIPHCIWEPAAGRGAIVRVLRDHGHAVIASDIYDYGGLHFVGDFLAQEKMPAGCNCILTNPPFNIAEKFVTHALELSPLVILLLRLAFLESERRCGILENRGLARVHVFRKRLPMMHRDQWEGRKANSGMAFAWYVFDRSHTGLPTVNRISWERENPKPVSATPDPMSPNTKEAMMAKPHIVAAESDKLSESDLTKPIEASDADTASVPQADLEQLDEEEQEFRALRRDLPGVQGASAAGIVAISVGKTPPKNEFFRTKPDFRPIISMVDIEVGMEKQFFAVTPEMVAALHGIGITVSDHVLYLTVTSRGALRIVPVRLAGNDGEQNEYARTKEIGLTQGITEWVRLYTDLENHNYQVFPAPAGRFADPTWPDLKPARIFKLAFRDKGRLLDSTEHPLFKKWAARDSA